MERMGHTSTRAALIYQHATRERDEAIAAAMGEVLASVRRKGPARSRSGTYRARRRGRLLMAAQCIFDAPLDLGFLVGAGEGAGEGNRTLMTSLEGWGSAIELRPRVPVGGMPSTG
jgi:hypothetical protein